MTLNKKHILLFLSIFVIMLIGATTISATADINNAQEVIEDKELSTPNNDVDKMVQSSVKNNLDAKVENSITSDNNDTKTITKTENKQTSDKTEINKEQILSENIIIKNKQINTKRESTQQTVNNYQELYDLLTTSNTEDLIVELQGNNADYFITERIDINNAIRNLTINGNSITIDGDNQYGFLTINKGMNLTINELIVKNCYDDITDGAVIHDSESSNITILNSFFENNYMDNDCRGGVLYQNSENFAIITINNTTFKSNFAYGDGGVLFIDNPTNLSISNSIFEGNKADDESLAQGGAIYHSNSAIYNPYFLTIENTKFTSNFAYYMGGSIYSKSNKVIINDSCFDNNYVTDSEESYGGAI